jgi:hypothetical protein
MANLYFNTTGNNYVTGVENTSETPTKSYWSSLGSSILNAVSETVNAIVTFSSYPRDHVIPHELPLFGTNLCDYSGKACDELRIKFLPHDDQCGIIYSSQMEDVAKEDCYQYCKNNGIYPISLDFLTINNLTGPYYMKSGQYKNCSILSKSITKMRDGEISIMMSNGTEREFVSLKAFCGLNNINYKNMLELLNFELKEYYKISNV